MDSDGDGVSNGAELQDPAGTWTAGTANPGDPRLVTNPGVSDASPAIPFLRGDANADGVVDLSDAVFMLESLCHRGIALPCEAAADSNRDGVINISDAVYSLEYMFSGGPPPPAPFPACGTHRTGLGCDGHPACG
jgi:hypothetical protein